MENINIKTKLKSGNTELKPIPEKLKPVLCSKNIIIKILGKKT